MSKNLVLPSIIITTVILIFASVNLLHPKEKSQLVIAPPSIIPSPTIILTIPNRKILENDYHVFQTFNNCGPAALSMALSYNGINISQEILGQDLRPYQIPGGDNDDKSVTLEELAQKAEDLGLIPYHRPRGNIDLVKKFISRGMPVITRTWTRLNEDIGHYRIIKGYDDTTHEIIQDDSLQGKNLRYSYGDFEKLWEKFNYEYLVLVPKEKENLALHILSEYADSKTAWQNAISLSKNHLDQNPDDIYARFNLSVALYNIGDFKSSTEEFEKVENLLPFRTLWYQIEPIEAYYELGNYEKVFSLIDKILNNANRAFSELYILRGGIYKKQGNIGAARNEFEKAVFYNKNLLSAQKALDSL